MDLTQYDRRKTIKRDDGSTLSYSIPAGVTDAQAAAEVARVERRIERGYSYALRFHDNGPRWREEILRTRDKVGFWLKCRWLDAYWFVKDRTRKQATGEE